jgi:uncharacterized membrane protein
LSDRTLQIVAGAVALVGAALAAYLTWVHYDESALVCVAGGGCETVQQSAYAEIAGVPVALLGLIAYSSVAGLVVWDTSIARLGAAMIAFVGLAFGLYLLVLQLFVIDAVCTWCVVNDVVVSPLLAVLTALGLRT